MSAVLSLVVSVEENEVFDFAGLRLDWCRLQVTPFIMIRRHLPSSVVAAIRAVRNAFNRVIFKTQKSDQ